MMLRLLLATAAPLLLRAATARPTDRDKALLSPPMVREEASSRLMAFRLLLLSAHRAALPPCAAPSQHTYATLTHTDLPLAHTQGWRAWYASNAHGLKDPSQKFVEASMEAMADRSRLVDGVPTSLADLGYTRASVDGRYLACAPSTTTACKYDCGGVNGSYHDAEGRPVLNKTGFPDVAAMVAKAHSLNLRYETPTLRFAFALEHSSLHV
jgi:hypothetical protein